MTILYFEALAAIAVSLSVLMAGAWVVQHRTGNSAWVDTIWTFSLGLVGAGAVLWPVADAAPNARQWLEAAPVAVLLAGTAGEALADGQLARRPLPRLPVAYQSVFPAAAASMKGVVT